MQGIIVRYRFDGDQTEWQGAIDDFIAAIAADGAVKGRFHYTVAVSTDGVGRTHMGRWDSDETLKTVQSRDYFKRFADALQRLAGDTLESSRMTVNRATE